MNYDMDLDPVGPMPAKPSLKELPMRPTSQPVGQYTDTNQDIEMGDNSVGILDSMGPHPQCPDDHVNPNNLYKENNVNINNPGANGKLIATPPTCPFLPSQTIPEEPNSTPAPVPMTMATSTPKPAATSVPTPGPSPSPSPSLTPMPSEHHTKVEVQPEAQIEVEAHVQAEGDVETEAHAKAEG